MAGSSTGEGLGNRFLAGIREADAICLVLRAFEDANVPGATDPLEDLSVLELELVLADLATVESQIDSAGARRPRPDKSPARRGGGAGAAQAVAAGRHADVPVGAHQPTNVSRLRPFFLLTNKPVLAVVNLGEDQVGRGRPRSSSRWPTSSAARRGARR